MTRLPININLEATEEDFQKSVVYFPVIGLIVGALLSGMFYLSNMVFGILLSSVIVFIAEILITGGIHLDGLADSCDGLYSYRNKERILEIMKDSRIGANGVLVLICYSMIKIALYNELGPKILPTALVLMPVFTKLAMMFSCRFFKYAREKGMGNFFIGHVSNTQLLTGTLFTFLITFLDIRYLIVLPIVIFISAVYSAHVTKIIDGITGDTLGALNEVSSIAYLFCVLLFSSLVW
jgi:adenosylcobinamide-GDP ribazoletransferase